MIKRQVLITNETGLHARPASLLVQTASKFKSSITIEKDEKQINVKSILMLLSAGISKGTTIDLIFDGEDEVAADAVIMELLNSNFGE